MIIFRIITIYTLVENNVNLYQISAAQTVYFNSCNYSELLKSIYNKDFYRLKTQEIYINLKF